MLAHPIPGAELRLTTDACDKAMGASLGQVKQEEWEPIGFFSKKFSPTQTRYSADDRELTAIYESVKFFRPWIEGSIVHIRMDHKPLVDAFKQKSDKASPRQQCQLCFISQFTTQISHIAGSENHIADALSRLDALRLPTVIDFIALAKAQAEDEELTALLKDIFTSMKLQRLTFGADHQALYCDISTDHIRPFVLKCFRDKVFKTFHELSQPSGKVTIKIICQRYVWPGMHKDIHKAARNCILC